METFDEFYSTNLSEDSMRDSSSKKVRASSKAVEVFSDTDASSKIPCLVALEMKDSIYSRLKGFLTAKEELDFVRRAK